MGAALEVEVGVVQRREDDGNSKEAFLSLQESVNILARWGQR